MAQMCYSYCIYQKGQKFANYTMIFFETVEFSTQYAVEMPPTKKPLNLYTPRKSKSF